MFCLTCNADNPEDATVCAGCGKSLSREENLKTVFLNDPESSATELGIPPEAPVQTGGFDDFTLPPPASLRFTPGTDFGPRYRIESQLGEGGMGTVYKAFDKELSRTVALKLVRPEYAASPMVMQRFRQELLLASKISHKNILRIHDLGDVDGVKFISMAFVEGKDLAGVLEAGKLPLERVLDVSRQLAGALEAAHAEDVVHRDLKPQNILVDAGGTIYVSDFGLAKSVEAVNSVMTRTGQILGTPRYMSPEQIEGKPLDHRSDLYTYGLILYELLTGDVPFGGEAPMQLMYQRVMSKPKSPKSIDPEIPDYLAAIIMRCLEKDPAARYQNAREILRDLDAARPPARPALTIAMPKLPMPEQARHWWLPIGVGALAVALVALAIPGVRNAILHRGNETPSAVPAGATAQSKFLAILPFQISGEQESLHYAGEGMVEALGAKLSGLHDVYVAAPSAVDNAMKKTTPAQIAQDQDARKRVAHDLGVGLLLLGSLERSGDNMKVTISLADVNARKVLWSDQFVGLQDDLLTIEDQIYAKILTALAVKPTNEEMARGTVRPTEDIKAYDLYLKGRNILTGKLDVKAVNNALNLFEQALKIDPKFALAYAGVADAGVLMYGLTKDSFWPEKALGAARQAERLNDNLTEAHAALGKAYLTIGRTAEATAEMKRALELTPNSDEAHRRMANAFLAAGQTAEALQEFQRAIQINPYYYFNYNQLGAAYFQLGRNDEAMSAFSKVTQLEPDRASGYANIGAVLYREGKWDECVQAYEKAISLQPSPKYYSNLGVTYFYMGRYADAAAMFEKAVEMSPNEFVAVGNLADAYRQLGQTDKAKTTYEKAIALGYKEFEVNPKNAQALGSLALDYAKEGNKAQAQRFIDRARGIDKNDNALMYKQAVIQALAGQPSDALRNLRDALQNGYSTLEAKNDPELKGLRGDPQFEKMLTEFSKK